MKDTDSTSELLPITEQDKEFYDREYFLGTSKKRGEFSLVEINQKYLDRTNSVLERFHFEEVPHKVTILDIGAGAAPFARVVDIYKQMGRYTNVDVISLDLSISGIREVEGGEPKFVQANSYETPFPNNSMDGVVVWDVLEHTNNPAKILQEIYRVLKPGGIAHIIVPNPEAYTRGSDKDTYNRDKSHIFPPITNIKFFQQQMGSVGFEVEIYTRGFPETNSYNQRFKKDLLKPATVDASGTHIVVIGSKQR
jgi:SAM-dependent methyltransferase